MSGPCAKRQVHALLVLKDGRSFVGENYCLRPQAVCPREPGEGYEKCRTVCGQAAHAEVRAIQKATAATKSDDELRGARMAVSHHYGCDNCHAHLDRLGIKADFIAPADSERTPNH